MKRSAGKDRKKPLEKSPDCFRYDLRRSFNRSSFLAAIRGF